MVRLWRSSVRQSAGGEDTAAEKRDRVPRGGSRSLSEFEVWERFEGGRPSGAKCRLRAEQGGEEAGRSQGESGTKRGFSAPAPGRSLLVLLSPSLGVLIPSSSRCSLLRPIPAPPTRPIRGPPSKFIGVDDRPSERAMPSSSTPPPDPHSHSSFPPSPSSYFPGSFVYPVRSLLSGIQPAQDIDTASSHTTDASHRPAPSSTATAPMKLTPSNSSDSEGHNTDSDAPASSTSASDPNPLFSGQIMPPTPASVLSPMSAKETPSTDSGTTPRDALATPAAPTGAADYFARAPKDSRTRTWTTTLPAPPPPTSLTLPRPPSSPSPPPGPSPPNDPDPLSSLFDSDSDPDGPHPTDTRPRGPLSLVEAGIVRLPPSEPSTSSARASVSSSRAQQYPPHRSRSHSHHPASSHGTGSSSAGSNQPILTRRFEHRRTEAGHHVIVGREGRLERCEDEPIRVPGAVQGFGVLIAVEEDDETGNLVVRQVSENSTELLGLSPSYLFSLTCLTQTLPPAQADILWDNVQYLYELDSDAEGGTGQDSPQVFLLSGWGEPGSASDANSSDSDGPEMGDPHVRREWTCWCAAHRPAAPRGMGGGGESGRSSAGTDTTLGPSMLILEFELERDTFNPLYPPAGAQYPSSSSSSSSAFSSSGSPGVRRSSSSGGSSPSSSVRGRSGSATASSVGSGSGGGSSGGGSSGQASGGSASTGGSVGSTTTLHQVDHEQQQQQQQVDPTHSPAEGHEELVDGTESDGALGPSPEDVLESTTNRARPLKALERMRRVNRQVAARATGGQAALATVGAAALESGDAAIARVRRGETALSARARALAPGQAAGVSTMDVFALLSQVDDQWGRAADLEAFLKIVVGIVKDLTQFHRVLVYQFDEHWNGQVVAELVDWNQTHDLYKGLHFPAGDIPAQARQLYAINKVRLLYDRSQLTARLVVRSKADLDPPLDMTHSYLRAMSPIHIKYLENMGVRASMSVSIMAFGQLWGLIACHSYGQQGMRVSFPVRQMLRLMSDSISRNIERLSYAQRLHTRKLISTLPTDQHPTGYIVSNAEDLLGLFDADFGILVIGEGAKILGPNHSGQEVLIVAEYLRLKQFNIMQVSQAVTKDFPDLNLPSGLDVVAGLLYIPLSSGGRDFIAFLRKGSLKEVHWAGKPFKEEGEPDLEPRKSFKIWSETIAGRSRAWTDDQLETAGVLALVYGKFIEIWRQKETAIKTTQLTNLLLSNASHEVRTPLNHIINYLELAMNGSLDGETRENLRLTHVASKSLLFTINDLLDLTRLESGNETSFNEPFDLPNTIEEAIHLYRIEAERRKLTFVLDTEECPTIVVGDARKIRTVVANLTANAVKFTREGTITVECRTFREPAGLRDKRQVAVEIVVGDTGCGIAADKLESIFREFEQVESSGPKGDRDGLGLGLAVVARIVEQLGGQLRVDSKVDQGSRFSFLVPFALPSTGGGSQTGSEFGSRSDSASAGSSGRNSRGSRASAIDSLVEALQSDPMSSRASQEGVAALSPRPDQAGQPGYFDVGSSRYPGRSVKVDEYDLDRSVPEPRIVPLPDTQPALVQSTEAPYDGPTPKVSYEPAPPEPVQQPKPASTRTSFIPRAKTDRKPIGSPTAGPSGPLRILIAEDDPINRTILHKRLVTDGHTVLNTTNGQEALEKILVDRDFDCILMDIQMPLLNGFEATERIRAFEKANPLPDGAARTSIRLNGRIPIFAVSASLLERDRESISNRGIDGWMLKPIDFRRLGVLMRGITDPTQRQRDLYKTGHWEQGGWFGKPLFDSSPSQSPKSGRSKQQS